MRIKHMFKKTVMDIRGEERENTPEVPDNLMRKCNACKAAVFVDEVKQNHYICPHCGNYFHMPAYRRIKMIADRKSFVEWDAEMEEQNPLQYRGYEEKLRALQEKTGLNEAVVTGKCTIKGISVALGVCDCRFMMSSMGEVVGEKITCVFERATEEKLPVILYICSGGARMQEGLVSLMQMAKTSMALRKHSDAGLLYVPVLTDPTTGGVTASFAMLGDIILAEPKALIGFAGPRVIEQTIGQKLPKGFQKAEFLLEHGFIDKIVERDDQRIVLADILKLHENKGQNSSTSKVAELHISDKSNGNTVWPKFIPSGSFTPWEHVQLARAKTRPTGKDYIEALFDDFIEFHGDRHCGDDAAVIGGVAFFHGHPVTVLAQEKGEGTKENIARNFGMVSPEGFASILWKDSKKAKEAAEVMKLTAADLCEMGMIEHVIPETEPVSRENMEDVVGCLENGIADFLEKYSGKEPEELLEHRYQRFRKM